MTTFNVLGSQHSAEGGAASEFAAGTTRIGWAVELLAAYQSDIVGFSELQSDQYAVLAAASPGFAFYPGTTLGQAGVPTNLMWRDDVWESTWQSHVTIPFMDGTRPMPVVRLRHRETGREIYAMNVHNSPRDRQGREDERDRAEAIEIAAVNALAEDGVPIVLMGDFNEHAEVFCRVTAQTTLVAASGGSPSGTHRRRLPAARRDARRLDLRVARARVRRLPHRHLSRRPPHHRPRRPQRDRDRPGPRAARPADNLHVVPETANLTTPRVDDAGIHLPAGFSGSCDVLFDDHHAWSFSAKGRRARGSGAEVLVAWPARMGKWLDGTAYVRVVEKDREIFAGEVVFGKGRGRVEFVDRDGIPVMIDKWGLLQRPFSGRDRRVIVQMVDRTEEILEVMRRECGVRGWIAFGTLLGAAREGKVIGHDSDIDLAYVSEKPTPAEMTVELYAIARALRAHGMTVLDKSGSFITVVFPVPDGSKASIDVYTCFYVGDVLYETATVRAVVPRSAIEPLGEMEFEGRMLPTPADPAAMLAVSYGPSWQVPDPSFRHEPGPEITDRFDGWFGSLMRSRRDWERYLTDLGKDPEHGPSDFATWVADRLEPGTRVIEVGSGTGQDAAYVAGRGFEVRGFDYARTSLRPARKAAKRLGVPAKFQPLNLYDLRDVLTRAALLCRRVPEPRRLRPAPAGGPRPRRPGELLALHDDAAARAAGAPTSRARRPRRATAPSGGPSTAAEGSTLSTRAWSRARPPGSVVGSCTGRASSQREPP